MCVSAVRFMLHGTTFDPFKITLSGKEKHCFTEEEPDVQAPERHLPKLTMECARSKPSISNYLPCLPQRQWPGGALSSSWHACWWWFVCVYVSLLIILGRSKWP